MQRILTMDWTQTSFSSQLREMSRTSWHSHKLCIESLGVMIPQLCIFATNIISSFCHRPAAAPHAKYDAIIAYKLGTYLSLIIKGNFIYLGRYYRGGKNKKKGVALLLLTYTLTYYLPPCCRMRRMTSEREKLR